MSHKCRNDEADAAVEKPRLKCVESRKKVAMSPETCNGEDGAGPRRKKCSRSKHTSKQTIKYNESLHELLKYFPNPPDHLVGGGGLRVKDEDLREDCAAAPPHESQVLSTETDVTLPSSLNDSLHPQGTEVKRNAHDGHKSSNSCSPSFLAKVYEEMMTIYEQLKEERLGQQQWEIQLQKRERCLVEQEDALGKMLETPHLGTLALEEKHRQEVKALQELLRERNKENKRLKSSFDTIKELNDGMKKQINVISEHNKKLESQSKRLKARLDNLQRKHEHHMALKGLQKACAKTSEPAKSWKKGRNAASGKPSNKASSTPTTFKLLALLLDWVLDAQAFSTAAGCKGNASQRPSSVVSLNERCLQGLPLLADQLHLAPSSEPDFLLNLLRLMHCVLRHLDSTKQHVALSATLRRIGEEVSMRPAQSSVPEHVGPPQSRRGRDGPLRTWPLYQSPCPHTSILSILIILRTVTQADMLAQVLDRLRAELACEGSRGLFIQYGGVCAILSVLQAGRGLTHTLVDVLSQLSEQSRLLPPFLEACSCEEFFHVASQLMRNPRLELPSLEKLSILLQKLSTIRKNRRLFELTSLHLQVQELLRQTDPANSFLRLNLRSILLNIH